MTGVPATLESLCVSQALGVTEQAASEPSGLTYRLCVFRLPSENREISFNAQLKDALVSATFPSSLQSLYVSFCSICCEVVDEP